jgi:hypothetical protein
VFGLRHFFKYDLLSILFQVYCPLALLKDHFTHYDLHPDNILLYSAKDNHYFLCHYHLPDSNDVISFRTKFIAKIIDYGKCFFNDTETGTNSKKIQEALCEIKQCDPDCGKNFGFHILNNKHDHRDSTKRNVSFDLLALKTIKDALSSIKTLFNEDNKNGEYPFNFEEINVELHNLLWSFVKFNNGIEIYDSSKMNSRNQHNYSSNNIYNVDDAYKRITGLMKSEKQIKLNK